MVKIETLYFVLGRKCNLSCGYCKQCNEREIRLPERIGDKTRTKIKEILRIHKPPLVLFTGGEPLLYIRQLKEVIELCEEVYEPIFFIYSNGSLLTDELAEYFNAHRAGFNISYDGIYSIDTRGYNVLTDKKQTLLKLNKIKLGAVMTGKAYPMTDVIEPVKSFYAMAKILGKDISFIEEPILPVSGKYFEPIPDPEKIKAEMYEVCKKALQYLRGQQANEIYYKFASSYLFRPELSADYSCGIGLTTMVIDLDGNVLTCPSVSESVGNINREDTDTLMDKAYRAGVTRDEADRNICGECFAKTICHYGCRLVRSPEERRIYCDGYKALAEPVIWLRSIINDSSIQCRR